jgi:hypothetical protein
MANDHARTFADAVVARPRLTAVKGVGPSGLMMVLQPVSCPMHSLRQRLPRFAALVLLVWLFATGVAFAHACTTEIQLDCEDCCTEMRAVEAWTETSTVTPLAAPADIAEAVVVLALPPWQAADEAPHHWREPPAPGGRPDIPIFFLRLAL